MAQNLIKMHSLLLPLNYKKMTNNHRFKALAIVVIIFITSCTSFQYITMESDLPKSQYNDFFFENDTIQIVYSFDGSDCPINLNIYNKLKKPLYINWDKSAIVINGTSRPLKPNISLLSGMMDGISIASNNLTYSFNDLNGSIKHSDRLGFIPPESELNISTSAGQSGFIDITKADSSAYNVVLNSSYDQLRVKEHYYSKDTSPLNVRCFITYTDNSDATQSFTDSNFWISKIFKSSSSTIIPSPDRYHVSKITNFGGFVAIVGLTAIIVATAAIETPESVQ